MSSDEKKIKDILAKLETSTQKIIATRGYTDDAKVLKVLEELFREQLEHANTRSTTRTLR